LADIRPINVDDTDSILHAFYRNVKLGKATSTHGLLPNMTAEEKQLLAEKEKEINGEPEKRQLDETAQEEAATANIIEKAHANGVTA
jgi:homocitrate synthase